MKESSPDIKWKPRLYEEGEEERLVEMLDVVFSPYHSIDYWKWKYKENPEGFHPQLICVADDHGKIAGQYSIIPYKVKIGEELISASQSVDTATHPDYRRQGMFEKLANIVYSNAEQMGIAFTYGFAAEGPSYFGFVKKLGWHHICFLEEFYRYADVDAIVDSKFGDKKFVPKRLLTKMLQSKGKSGLAPLPGVSIKEASGFDERVDDLWQRVSADYQIIVARSKRYFDWRLANPDARYTVFQAEKDGKLIGYTILRTRETEDKKIGYIGDIIALPEEDGVIPHLLEAALEHFKQEHVHTSICQLPEAHRYIRYLSDMGYKRKETRMGLIARINIKEKVSEESIKSVKNWFITMIDSDHI